MVCVASTSINNKQLSEYYVKQWSRNILQTQAKCAYMAIIIAHKQRKISSSRVELHSNKIVVAVTILTYHHIIAQSYEITCASDTI